MAGHKQLKKDFPQYLENDNHITTAAKRTSQQLENDRPKHHNMIFCYLLNRHGTYSVNILESLHSWRARAQTLLW